MTEILKRLPVDGSPFALVHNALVDMANELMRAVPNLIQNDPLDNANLFLRIVERAYWRGYKDGKQSIFRVEDTP